MFKVRWNVTWWLHEKLLRSLAVNEFLKCSAFGTGTGQNEVPLFWLQWPMTCFFSAPRCTKIFIIEITDHNSIQCRAILCTKNMIVNYERHSRGDGCWLSVVAGWLGAWAGAAGCSSSSGMPFTTQYQQLHWLIWLTEVFRPTQQKNRSFYRHSFWPITQLHTEEIKANIQRKPTWNNKSKDTKT